MEAKPALQLPPRAAPLQVYVRACSTDLHKQKSTTPRLVWLHVPSHFSAIGSELYVMEQYHMTTNWLVIGLYLSKLTSVLARDSRTDVLVRTPTVGRYASFPNFLLYGGISKLF